MQIHARFSFGFLLVVVCSLFLAVGAEAQTNGFNLTFSGPNFTGSIFLSATPNGDGTFTVTSAKGVETLSGGTLNITGVVAPTACCGAASTFFIPGTGSFYGYDDILAPTALQVFDGNGLLLNFDGIPQPVLMFYDATNKYGDGMGYQLASYVGSGGNDLLDPAFNDTLIFVQITPSPSIASVEFTQAIQQYQALTDLINSLNTTGEPPVPIIAAKPAVMRVYFNTVTDATDVTLTAGTTFTGTKTVSLQPGCSPADQRIRNRTCQSVDIYLNSPPEGPWVENLTVTDSSGNQIETETLNLKSRTTTAINLKAIQACTRDLQTTPPVPGSCGDPSLIYKMTSSLSALAPTGTVQATVLPGKIESILLFTGSNPTSQNLLDWIVQFGREANNLYMPADQAADFSANQRTTYYGIYNSKLGNFNGHPQTSSNAASGGIPSHGAAGPDIALRTGDSDATADTMAHEVSHTLNLHHTNIAVTTPEPSNPPGCWSTASDSGSGYPYPDNFIHSQLGPAPFTYPLEVGFSVATQTPIDPSQSFDLMSYCTPRWITPYDYNRLITTLGGGLVSSGATAPIAAISARTDSHTSFDLNPKRNLAPTITTGAYWQISGTIDPVNGVSFSPIFAENVAATTDSGSGTYTIKILDASSNVLYERFFTPLAGDVDTAAGDSIEATPSFSEWVPVTAGAASFVVLDPGLNTVGTLAVTGASPVVTITSPIAGFVGSGTAQTVSWTIQDSDSTSFTSRVLYSPDGGATWFQLGDTADTSDTEDFTQLPGSTNALIRVLVSDGVNTGSATSVPFTVPRKLPSSVAITNPPAGYAQASADPVQLIGGAFDPDDGFLTGNSLSWKSDIQGVLGTGSPLSVNLNPGTHNITLTATDSDGNSVSASLSVLIGGGRPMLTLSTSSPRTNCTSASIVGSPGNQGAPLAMVEYSLDGGATYTTIPLAQLPYSFVVPGSGNINLVAVASDLSHQITARSTRFALTGTCIAGIPSLSGGSSQSTPIGAAFATPLSALISDSKGNPVAGVAVNFSAPATGASATLSPATATSNSSGIATTTATANSTNGSYNVVATVPGFSTTAQFSLTNTNFTFGVDNSSLTVMHGSTATATVTVTPLSGFNSPVVLACTGLPVGVTCSFSPATVTPAGGQVTSTLTITAADNATTSTIALRFGLTGGGLTLVLCLVVPGRRRRRKFIGVLALTSAVAVLSTISGCASFTPFSSGVTITATSGTLQHTSTISISVK
jgi:hypothetical protein